MLNHMARSDDGSSPSDPVGSATTLLAPLPTQDSKLNTQNRAATKAGTPMKVGHTTHQRRHPYEGRPRPGTTG